MIEAIIGLISGFIGGLIATRMPLKRRKSKQRVFRPAEEIHEPRRTRITQNLDTQTFEKELKRAKELSGSL
jgi:hypothetical protein